MFDFKKKILSPLVKSFTDKIDEALKRESVADKIEMLLSVKDAVNESFSKVSKRGLWKGSAGPFAMIAGLYTACASGLLVVGALSVGALLSSPLVLAGAALYVGGALLSLSLVARSSQIQTARKPLEAKIDSEVNSLVEKNPQEVVKSTRFLKALKERFSVASASETEVNQLRLALAPTPAVEQRTP